MVGHKYAYQTNENQAKAVGRDLGISTKTSVEVCRFLRGKNLVRAKKELSQVMKKDLAVPYKRYNKDTPHRTKLGPGRYPHNVAEGILNVLEGVTSNAQSKGLSTAKLSIVHICAHKASSPMRGGRRRGREGKRTHIEVVVQETKQKEKKKIAKKVQDKMVAKDVGVSKEKPDLKIEKKVEAEEKSKVPETEVKKESKTEKVSKDIKTEESKND
jgi:large subunit ribosomal protein L22